MKKSNTILNNQRHLTTFDLRAELLFDSLLDNNFLDENINIKYKGLFYRGFNKDKMSIHEDVSDKDVLNIDISRDGFYDILPESISHNYRNSEQKEDVVTEFKNRKREEKEARHFFNPIENEFFRFKHQIEKYESDFFADLSADGIVDIIKLIMVVENTIPDHLIVKMFYALLKQNESKKHSIESICKILEGMLVERVSYTTSNIKLENVYDIENKNDNLILGINTTLASSQEIFLKKYNFIIGPLKNPENLENYFQNQTIETFVTTFFNLFLPLQVQFSFDVKLDLDSEQFWLDESVYKSRLGISTVL